MNEHVLVSTCASVMADTSPTRHQELSRPSLSLNSADCIYTQRWGHITRSLSACNSGEESASEAAGNAARQSREYSSCEDGMNATIEILDRLTPVTAILSWRDSTGCCYGYQSWYRCLAKRAGRCALTGTPIRRGDVVFRPTMKGARPANAFAMILAVYIESPLLTP